MCCPKALDLLWLLLVNLGDFVFRIAMHMQQFIELGMDCLSRCSARWMKSVIIQVISVARPCHSSVSGLKMSQEIP
ncbi:hypothetical protein [Rhizobium leguminosarum]|uniref:hypothetical protein n=1 Tax=Rhizobium leguminosarum TaxID=384 RepID=UPI001C90A769|nr:hypothetical protein [Rhizobium leguminosarum]MBY2949236.1 hypothetical protein [Rhizobium leguminosarum]